MDKAILKKFAIESRKDLMQKMENKIKSFYVDEEFTKQQNGEIYLLSNEKHTLSLTKEEYEKRELLVKRINELGLNQVIEESAYTWFNRIVAIRYMEINDYLPLTKDNQSLGIRVLSSKDNTCDPEIMKFTNLVNPELDINFKKEIYIGLSDDEKFKYVLLLICKKIGQVIPQVFDGITDYIDILIPDNLLNDMGFIAKIINEIPESSFDKVEIIGWLYQYYNQIEKDRVISSKKTYKRNEIAYATQLFTPGWIVKYMVENSVGKYWLEHSEKTEYLLNNWKYFINKNINKLNLISPENIKFIDPCCGSGHILVYAFEIFYQIYESQGYNKKDIVEKILEKNLFGIDIDYRAEQLSVLSVLLKAREYDKDMFSKIKTIKNLNIVSISETEKYDTYMLDELNENDKEQAKYLFDKFKYGKEIGSLTILENKDYTDLEKNVQNNETIFGIELQKKILPLIKQATILNNKYDLVVTNPPYMNNSVMTPNLKKFIYENYSEAKSDMFSSFVIKNSNLVRDNGYLGFMTPYVWMFISSYEGLRKYIINNLEISSLVQLEYSALEEATVPICSFVLKKGNNNAYGEYIRLVDFKGGMAVQNDKYLEIINNKDNKYYFEKITSQFNETPNNVISYWLSDRLIDLFKDYETINEYVDAKQGMTTSDNKRFLKLWNEVDYNKIGFGMKNTIEAKDSKKKWFPYNKGGEYRKWYGNNDYLVNFYNDGEEMEQFHAELNKTSSGGRIKNKDLYFQKCISWSKISSASLSFRYKEDGFIFDVAGSSIFGEDRLNKYILGLFNSKLGMHIIGQISPTLNFEAEQIKQMPIIRNDELENIVVDLVDKAISLSKEDWDTFETSWDFKCHPLIKNNLSPEQIKKEQDSGFIVMNDLESSFKSWERISNDRFNELKNCEEKINELLINAYGLENELDSKVDERDVTIRKADKVRDVKSLISYAVGCMFGRYSLDRDGLIYASGNFKDSLYNLFSIDSDNIIPITEESFFGDDIVSRFKKFIEIAFGVGTLNKNIDFIAETLGKKGTETSEETIRRYFLNDFYSDHIKMYQKKPIYWLFDSGKKNGFKALIYMHRYNENTVPKVRLDYLHRIQTTYEKLLADINYKLTTDLSMTDKKEAQRKQVDLNNKLTEIKEYDEKVAHIANQRINIDLDDGVTVNYAKFEDILAKIK